MKERKMKKYEYAVLIGRFQPLHVGHLSLVEHAFAIAKKLIIIVGSHNAPTSIRNPWNSTERECFIRSALNMFEQGDLKVLPINDSAYNFNDWVLRVQQKVTAITGEKKVVIVGHYKDDTSYYLNYFPQWNLDTLPTQADGISATCIRNAIFENKLDSVAVYLPVEVISFLKDWEQSKTFKRLQEEYVFIQNYRKKWENAPFPPVFVTADAVVFAIGHVLLVKRKFNPGKGMYALPGGFVNQNESIERACTRELKEETSIDIGFKELHGSLKMRHVFDHPLRDPRGRVITHAFMYELNVRELPLVKASDDAEEVVWFPLFRIEENESSFFNDHAQIIKYFINRMN
jgi:bifunctional NMN adenylyltransferase/nudix hydrolase